MRDADCVDFLQWALPQMHLRWAGFRKVRGQVCKRIARRMQQLGIDSLDEYRSFLEQHVEEWAVLDRLARITISRFYRDRQVFVFMEKEILPQLARHARILGKHDLHALSIGCGCGEEPYTLRIIWQQQLQAQYPELAFYIEALDVDSNLLERARQGCYSYGCIKDLPGEWCTAAFEHQDRLYCLKPDYRQDCTFRQQDIRELIPTQHYDLVLCRNLVFTYFDAAMQRTILQRLNELLRPGGVLVIGIHEQLPENTAGFETCSAKLRVYQKPYPLLATLP